MAPAPVDTVTREGVQLPGRKVPPKYQVDEDAVQLRGGVRTTSPLMLPAPGDEGYRPYRRGGIAAEEGFRSYGHGVGTTEASRAVLTVGAPVIPEGAQAARLIPSTGAWVPPISGAPSSEYGYGAGRFTPSGTYGGYGSSAGGSTNRSGDVSRSTATTSSSSSSSSAGTAATSSAPSQTASQAQAERSAASRAEVSATRAAGGKPNPNP